MTERQMSIFWNSRMKNLYRELNITNMYYLRTIYNLKGTEIILWIER